LSVKAGGSLNRRRYLQSPYRPKKQLSF